MRSNKCHLRDEERNCWQSWNFRHSDRIIPGATRLSPAGKNPGIQVTNSSTVQRIHPSQHSRNPTKRGIPRQLQFSIDFEFDWVSEGSAVLPVAPGWFNLFQPRFRDANREVIVSIRLALSPTTHLLILATTVDGVTRLPVSKLGLSKLTRVCSNFSRCRASSRAKT